MSALDKIQFTQTVIKDYLTYIKKYPNSTPKQLLSMLYLERKAWFKSLYPNELDYFNEALKKTNNDLDIDPLWEVSVSNQKKAAEVFNRFLQQMKGISLGSRRDIEMTNATLSEEFDRVFKIRAGGESITKAISTKPQLKQVGKKLLKELTKLGYKFQ